MTTAGQVAFVVEVYAIIALCVWSFFLGKCVARRQERCTCGSGGHPRRCTEHPERFQAHIDELNAENRKEP